MRKAMKAFDKFGKRASSKSDPFSHEDEASQSFGKHCFIIHNPGEIEDYFDMGDELKVGGSAKIICATEIATKVKRAIKRISKRNNEDFRRLAREVAVMKGLDHPNIIKLFETFQDEKYLYLVLELCEGGDIMDRLLDSDRCPSGCMSELQVSVIVRAVFLVLHYLHTNDIVHRDIKAENIMFKEKFADHLTSALRVVDYGYANFSTNDMTTKVGSLMYMAPETIAGHYDKAVDMWSCGVLCYLLLSGYAPFGGVTDGDTLQLIQKGEFIFHRQRWCGISMPAKHLIRSLLRVDPSKRMTLKSALLHPWVRSRGAVQVERVRDETIDRLITYHTHSKLRRCAMMAIAYQLETQDIKGPAELFHSFDLNGDGLLTTQEFMQSIASVGGVNDEFLDDMLTSVDADGSGIIDFTEFLAATLERDMYIHNHAALLRAFRCFDQDDGGSVSADEIMDTLLLSEFERDEIDKALNDIDMNGDGEMDYGEFVSMLQQDAQVEAHLFEDDLLEMDPVGVAGHDDDAERESEDEEHLEGEGDAADEDEEASEQASSSSSEDSEGSGSKERSKEATSASGSRL